ncbi:GPI-anchored protein LLG3 [Linum perenne]
MASAKAFIWVACFVLLLQIVSSQIITVDAPAEAPIAEAPQADNINNIADHPGREMKENVRHHKHHHRNYYPIPKPDELKPCKIDFFDKVDYMPLFKACEPPRRVKGCCNGFKDIACRYTNFLNDNTTWCAINMFMVINQYYPRNYFNENCKEGRHGMDCKTVKLH